MAEAVVSNAMLKCMFGLGPGTLTILPTDQITVENQPIATMMDYIPMMNIGSFNMCNSPMNPQFIAATAAAMGTPTPVPCIPVTIAPWVPPCIPPVLCANKPAIDKNSMCSCMWAPMGITISQSGTTKTTVP